VTSEENIEFILSLQDSIIDLDSRLIELVNRFVEIEKIHSDLMTKITIKLTRMQQMNILLCEEINRVGK